MTVPGPNTDEKEDTMKKLLIVSVVLLLLFSWPAVSENIDASFFYGTWVSASTQPEGRYTLIALHFQKDGTVYFTRHIFIDGLPTDSVQEAWSWVVNDGGVIVTDKSGKETQYSVFSDDFIGNKKGFIYYGYSRLHDVNPMFITNPQISQEGVTASPGQYVVGVDLPAGRYRFVAPDGIRKVYVEVYRADKAAADPHTYWMIGAETDMSDVVVTLNENDTLNIDRSSVIIKPYAGIF